MSALIRRIVKRAAALNVLRPQSNLQSFATTGIGAPKLLSNLSVLSAKTNFPTTVVLAQRFLSNAKGSNDTTDKQVSTEDFIQDVKPEAEKSIYDKLVRSNKVVVFMKGTPKSPRCGFSNAVVQIFRMHGVEYDAHDVLENAEVREGIKKYTDWPTIPQVFINGEFVGGCDILLEMHQSGELVEKLGKVGITSELLRLEREVEAKEAKAKKGKTNDATK